MTNAEIDAIGIRGAASCEAADYGGIHYVWLTTQDEAVIATRVVFAGSETERDKVLARLQTRLKIINALIR